MTLSTLTAKARVLALLPFLVGAVGLAMPDIADAHTTKKKHRVVKKKRGKKARRPVYREEVYESRMAPPGCSAADCAALQQSDSAQNQRIQDLEMKLADLDKRSKNTGNRVFFRGGYTQLNEDRGNQVFTDTFNITGNPNDGDEGWYVGAGFDFVLTRDLWGMMNKNSGIWVDAELMVEWKRFESQKNTNTGAIRVVPAAVADLGTSGGLVDTVDGGATTTGPAATTAGNNAVGVTMSMLTISAAPKIKFMAESRIQPWIIPAGLALHVISPPSNAGTVLNPGVMFGAGVDFNLWRGLWLGIDGRYHLTGNEADGVNTDHFTAGGNLGIAF
jgi:hypothetical protein